MRTINNLQLKIIGFVCLVLSNIAWSGIVPSGSVLQFILGFLGAPAIVIFLFSMNEALKFGSSLNKYMIRLLILALVSAFPYYMVFSNQGDNSFKFANYLSSPFTVFYCVGILYIFDKIKTTWIRNGSMIFFIIISLFLGIEWAPISIIVAYILHVYDTDEKRKYRDFNIIMLSVAILVASGFLYFFGGSMKGTTDLFRLMTTGGCALSIPLIRIYNGENNTFIKKWSQFIAKWCFYFAYPALLGVLVIIKFILINK